MISDYLTNFNTSLPVLTTNEQSTFIHLKQVITPTIFCIKTKLLKQKEHFFLIKQQYIKFFITFTAVMHQEQLNAAPTELVMPRW